MTNWQSLEALHNSVAGRDLVEMGAAGRMVCTLASEDLREGFVAGCGPTIPAAILSAIARLDELPAEVDRV